MRLQKQRGYLVAPLSLDDLRDVTAMRQYIDVLALRRSIAHGSLDWEAAIVASFHRLSRIDISAPARRDVLHDVVGVVNLDMIGSGAGGFAGRPTTGRCRPG